jgi:hypothetical protein
MVFLVIVTLHNNSFTMASLKIHTCVFSSLMFCAYKKTGTEKERDRCTGRDREGEREKREKGRQSSLIPFFLSAYICPFVCLSACLTLSLSSLPSFYPCLTLKYRVTTGLTGLLIKVEGPLFINTGSDVHEYHKYR